MAISEECKEQLIEKIIDTIESIKADILKEEKGSLNEKLMIQIRAVSSAYMILTKKLLTEEDALKIAEYLYWDFEKPALSYLGFATPKMFPY